MNSFDLTLLHWANHFVARSDDAFYQALSQSDRASWVIAAGALVALWCVRSPEPLLPSTPRLDGRRRVLLLFAAMASSFVVARILQHFFNRMRPLAEAPMEVPIDPAVWKEVKAALSLQGSFPSDHAVMFAVVVVGVIAINRWAGVLTILVSLYFLVLRMGVGFHWPSDVLAGAVVGTVMAVIALAVGKRWHRPLDLAIAAFDRFPVVVYPLAFLVLLDFSEKFSMLFYVLSTFKGVSQLIQH